MTSNRIRGITIEINSDITKLGKGLKNAEGSSKSLQKELQSINILLKVN